MKKRKLLIIIMLLTLCIGCKKETDSMKFKKEYEKYNQDNIKLNIEEENIIKYETYDEINKRIKERTGVIFIGNPKDNLSRTAIDLLLKAADSTDLDTIYYINSLDKIEGLDNIEKKQIPLVLNVKDGKITSYHQGTIEDKTKLSEENELELYGIYLEGIHEVLDDSCDERC